MKSYPHLFSRLFCQPLMLHEPTRLSFESVLMSRMESDSAPAMAPREPSNRVSNIYEQIGNVVVIKIDGAIDKRIGAMEMECYGGVDLCDVDSALALALHSSAEKIVLDIDEGSSRLRQHSGLLRWLLPRVRLRSHRSRPHSHRG